MFFYNYHFQLKQFEKLFEFLSVYDIDSDCYFTLSPHQLCKNKVLSFRDRDGVEHQILWNGESWEELDIDKQINITLDDLREQLEQQYKYDQLDLLSFDNE